MADGKKAPAKPGKAVAAAKAAKAQKAPKTRKVSLTVSRLGYYIIIFGWASILINIVLAFEYTTLGKLTDKFFSYDLKALAFRAIMLFVPLIFSIIGYLVYQREKVLWKVIATGRKLESMNVNLQSNYKRLSDKLSEKPDDTEQDILVRDANQLAKNNLMLASSFLEFHARKVSDDKLLRALQEDQRRIHAIALMHEMLASSRKPGALSPKEYFKQVAADAVKNLGQDRVKLKFEAKSYELSYDTIIGVGVIINELVSNSCKHAFNSVAHPEINVTIADAGENTAMLSVGDNGTGMPKDLDINYLETLGMRIVNKVAKSLKGRIETNVTSAGTSIEVSFPVA